jgi:hypothetical protein
MQRTVPVKITYVGICTRFYESLSSLIVTRNDCPIQRSSASSVLIVQLPREYAHSSLQTSTFQAEDFFMNLCETLLVTIIIQMAVHRKQIP